jgi:hypothetical protein
MSNVKYRSGDFTIAKAVGGIRHESPLLPFLNEVLIFHQDFMQKEANFEALDYNTINADIGGNTAYLINESPREDAMGNCVRWTRSWARIPTTYDMPGGIYQFEFPGFDPGREPIVIGVKLTIHREFFLCGNNSPSGFAEWQDIPINQGLKIYEDGDPTEKTNILSSTSTPSLAAYKALVTGGDTIQIEDSKITPWAGSIFVREDYLVNAL